MFYYTFQRQEVPPFDEEFNIKLKRCFTAMTVFCVAFFLVSYYGYIPFYYVLRTPLEIFDILGAERLYNGYASFYESDELWVTVKTLLYVIQFLPLYVLYRTERHSLNQAMVHKVRIPKGGILAILAIWGFVNVSSIVVSYVTSAFYPSSESAYAYPTSVYGIVIVFVSSALLPAVFEELLFRGVLLRLLLPYNKHFAILFSALMFGLAHFSPSQSAFAFCFGVIAGFLYASTGSLVPGMIVHLINNAFSVFSGYCSQLAPNNDFINGMAGLIYIIPIAMALVYGAVIVFNRDVSPFGIRDKRFSDEPELNSKTVTVKLFSGNKMYVFCIVYAAAAACIHYMS